MAKRSKTVISILLSIIIIALIALVAAFAYRFSDGFNEDFKTFYITHDGKDIMTNNSTMGFFVPCVERFDVKYTFGSADSQPRDYSVKIIPNADNDFIFVANGSMYRYSSIEDLTSGFVLDKQSTYFELSFSQSFGVQNVLSNIFGCEIELLDYNPVICPFILIVSSYNEKVTYHITFAVDFFTLSTDYIVF